jgi:hypothetical protein
LTVALDAELLKTIRWTRTYFARSCFNDDQVITCGMGRSPADLTMKQGKNIVKQVRSKDVPPRLTRPRHGIDGCAR